MLNRLFFLNTFFLIIVMASVGVPPVLACQESGESPERTVWLAVANNNVREFDQLITAGADPHVKGKHDFTLLMAASWQGNDEIVKKLLKAGVEINAQNAYGDTALMIACCLRHEHVVRTLVEAEANVDLLNNDYRNASDCATGFTFEQNKCLDFGPDRRFRGYMNDVVKRKRGPASTEEERCERRGTLQKIHRIKMLLLKKMAVQEEVAQANSWAFSGFVAAFLMGWVLSMEWRPW